MPMGTILLIILVLLMIAAAPVWSFSNEWGYLPSAILGALLVILLVLLVLVRI